MFQKIKKKLHSAYYIMFYFCQKNRVLSFFIYPVIHLTHYVFLRKSDIKKFEKILKHSLLKTKEGKKVVFIHNPKAGGSSISQFVQNYKLTNSKTDISHLPAFRFILFLKYTKRKRSNYFIISSIRPVATRCVSSFMYYKRNDKSFTKEKRSKFIKKANYFTIFKSYVFFPQTLFLCDKNNNLIVDYVFRQENMNNDFNLFLAKFVNMEKKRQLRKLERKNSNPVQPSLAMQKDLAKLHKLYDLDFKLYETCSNFSRDP